MTAPILLIIATICIGGTKVSTTHGCQVDLIKCVEKKISSNVLKSEVEVQSDALKECILEY